MVILHVVGFKNSGKTTLLSRWIKLLKEKGLTVAVLKQHKHHSKLKMPDQQADSVLLYESGADVSIVSGGGDIQLLVHEQAYLERMKQLAILVNHPDVILVEGFKEEDGNKVVLLKDKQDWQTLQHIQGIQLVVGCPEETFEYDHIVSREHSQELDRWLLHYIERNDG